MPIFKNPKNSGTRPNFTIYGRYFFGLSSQLISIIFIKSGQVRINSQVLSVLNQIRVKRGQGLGPRALSPEPGRIFWGPGVHSRVESKASTRLEACSLPRPFCKVKFFLRPPRLRPARRIGRGGGKFAGRKILRRVTRPCPRLDQDIIIVYQYQIYQILAEFVGLQIM